MLEPSRWRRKARTSEFYARFYVSYVLVTLIGCSTHLFTCLLAYRASFAGLNHAFCVLYSTFRLLTWNIDGLDGRDLEERTIAVCQTILLKQPDVVYLQEVIKPTLAILQQKLRSKYHFFVPTNPPEHYFVAILVKQDSQLVPGSLSSTTFPGSCMGRQLLELPLSFHGLELHLMTSHLESMKDYSGERKAQLRTAFGAMVDKLSAGKTCIFGGDLNVREAEVKSVKVPGGVVDVWEACGSDRTKQFTWDLKNNDNLNWPYSSRPQARYDRVYFASSDSKLRPSRFELVGQDRLHDCGRFPSDHWGLWVEI